MAGRRFARWGFAVMLVVGSVVCQPGPAAAAAHVHVSVTGVDAGDCAVSACATIGYALSKVAVGGTVHVGPGNFLQTVAAPSGVSAVIQGAGRRVTWIDGMQSASVFRVGRGASVTLVDLAVTNGRAAAGGGIHNDGGSVVLDRVEVSLNVATDDLGGGVNNAGGALSIVDSVIRANHASAGGGIAGKEGTTTISRSLIAWNKVSRGAGAGVLSLDQSRFDINDSTVIDNGETHPVVTTYGSALLVFGSTGSANHLTIAGNRSSHGAVQVNPPLFTINASILADNIGDNCARTGEMSSTGRYNLDTDGSCLHTTDTVTGQDPGLGELDHEFGGYVPAAVGPATNAIPSADPLCDGTDQRGLPRRYRNVRACDIGSVQIPTPASLTVSEKVLDFGVLKAGTTGRAKVSVTNEGGTPTTVAAAVTGAGFSILGGTCANRQLVYLQSCAVEVGFTPSALPHQGVLTVTGGTAGVVPRQVALAGNTTGPPVNLTAPTITGTLRAGHDAVAAPGVWNGAGPVTYTYQWRHCDTYDHVCEDVPGATGSAYPLTKADAEWLLSVAVTAHNNDGAASVESEQQPVSL